VSNLEIGVSVYAVSFVAWMAVWLVFLRRRWRLGSNAQLLATCAAVVLPFLTLGLILEDRQLFWIGVINAVIATPLSFAAATRAGLR
jgi:hypothetical protein